MISQKYTRHTPIVNRKPTAPRGYGLGLPMAVFGENNSPFQPPMSAAATAPQDATKTLTAAALETMQPQANKSEV